MIIFPAIDLKDGQVVRLRQGRMDEVTVYADDPAGVARAFLEQGAEYLHIVDLDGAVAGKPANDTALKSIIQSVPLKIQIGGGIRTLQRIDELLSAGVERVILGTVAVRKPDLVREAIERFGSERIVVGIDAQNQWVAVEGWVETSEVAVEELGLRMKEYGVVRVIYTDIQRDGMLVGANLAGSVDLARKTGLAVIVSGGVAALADLKAIKEQVSQGVSLEGVIVGRALYSGAFSLAEALKVARDT